MLTWLLTRRAGGTLHLRIDDLDRPRLRPAYLENIFRTLDWLGLDYDHGPTGPADFEANYSQLHYLADYQRLLAELRQTPGLLYACRCSRTDVQRAGGHHDDAACRARALLPDAPETAWRAHVPAATSVAFRDLWQGEVAVPLAAEMGDFVVRKKDGLPAYQVASVADDVRLGTTFIVRGLDLLPSSAAQLWLAGQTASAAPQARRRSSRCNLPTTPYLPAPMVLSCRSQPRPRPGAASWPRQVARASCTRPWRGCWGCRPPRASQLAALLQKC